MRTFWRHLLTPEVQEGVDAQNGSEIVEDGLMGHAGAPFNRPAFCGDGIHYSAALTVI
jgi:hypothetical protein